VRRNISAGTETHCKRVQSAIPAQKYLCGHGDALGGVAVASSEEYINSLKFEFMCELGNVMSPFNAWLLLRGIKTLGLRMEVHEKNAKAVADFLSDHGKVRRVYYPGLNDTDFTHRQMRGCGGVVSFEPTGGIRAAEEFVGRLRLAKLAVSLGDAETLVQIPSRMTHRDYPTDRLKEFGFSEDLVRISVGLEDAEDILEDMSQALK
jgi:methionine-gamma-lyase